MADSIEVLVFSPDVAIEAGSLSVFLSLLFYALHS